jgi:peptidoglycan hydrolase CwlO-like protein
MKQVFRILSFLCVFSITGIIVIPVLVAYAQDASSLQSDISSLNKKLQKAQAKQATLATQLGQINTSLTAAQNVIVATKARIAVATNDIDRKQGEIDLIQNRIDENKIILTGLIRQIQSDSGDSLFSTVLSGDDVTQELTNPDAYQSVGERMNAVLADIHSSQDQAIQAKSDLEALKKAHEVTLGSKLQEKQALAADQQSTQADLADQVATVAELQKKLQKLQSDLSSLLGMVVSTDDVKKAAGIAADATGVRKSFILAELTQESGLGRYTGGCTYKNTRVKPADATVFKQIMKELGYDINSRKISCAGSVGYGGAMGIAQFMPTTWLGYKSYISGATGHNPPDPWSVIDGVMGMAKKLANGGATSKKGEYNASMLYYCGTTKPGSSAIKAACNNYAKNVQSLTNGYENN